MNTVEKKYSAHLREFISRKENGMLLRAEDYAGEGATDAHFELTSGNFSREYITIWELFDHPGEFASCIENLTLRAQYIHSLSPFTKIVSSTNTAKEIVNHLLPNLISRNFEVEADYFGDYPRNLNYDNSRSSFFSDDVLIVTDVIGSGILVRKLSKIIQDLGGKVVAILAIVITGKELLNNAEEADEDHGSFRVRLNDEAEPSNIYGLTTIPIDFSRNRPSGATIRIDPITVLPKQEIEFNAPIAPVFDLQTTFRHFMDLSIMKVGYYKFENKRYSVVYDIHRIFHDADNPEPREMIWEGIRHLFDGVSHIATTYKRDDIQFLSFVLSRAGREIQPIILKRDLKDTPHFYFSIKLSTPPLEKVVVLVSTLSTAAKLKNIASLLYSIGVTNIVFVCLINRMGLYNHSFIESIRNLESKGIRPTRNFSFKFVSVYNVHDIFISDLDKMHGRFNHVFESYMSQTQVWRLRRIAGDYKQLFAASTSLISRFYDRMPDPAIHPRKDVGLINYSRRPDVVTVNWEEEHMAVLINNFSITRDYEPLIQQFRTNENGRSILLLTGLFLCDLDFTIYHDVFHRIAWDALARIDELRIRRKKLEESIMADPSNYSDSKAVMQGWVRLEAALIFSIAAFSRFDDLSIPANGETIKELLFAGRHFSDWKKYPFNFEAQFQDVDLIFSVALLASGMPSGKKPSDRYLLYEEIRKGCNVLNAEFQSVIKAANRLSQRIQQVKDEWLPLAKENLRSNINLLLLEFGEFDVQSKSQIIRFLQTIWLREKQNHSYFYKTLMDFATLQQQDETVKQTREFKGRVRRGIEESSRVIANLFEINELIEGFMKFQAEGLEDSKAYLASTSGGLYERLRRVEGMFEGMAKSARVAPGAFAELRAEIKEIFETFYYWTADADKRPLIYSKLQVHLYRYIIPAVESMITVTTETLSQLPPKAQPYIIREVKKNFDSIKKEDRPAYLILCNYPVFRMIVQNLLTNIRYSDLERFDQFEFNIRIEREGTIMSRNENAVMQIVVISMITPGEYKDGQPDKIKTIDWHREQLESMGNQLRIEEFSNKTLFEMKFISRETYREVYTEYMNSSNGHPLRHENLLAG